LNEIPNSVFCRHNKQPEDIDLLIVLQFISNDICISTSRSFNICFSIALIRIRVHCVVAHYLGSVAGMLQGHFTQSE